MPAVKSIPRVPGETLYLYLWLLALLVFRVRIYLSKEFLILSPFLIIHLLYLLIDNYSGMDQKFLRTQADIFIGLFFALSLWAHLRTERNSKDIVFFYRTIVFALIVTSITTLVGNFLIPGATRSTVGGSDIPGLALSYYRLNIAGYNFLFLLALVSPIVLYHYIKTRRSFWLFIYFLFTTTVFFCQVTAATLIYGVSSSIAVLAAFTGQRLNYKLIFSTVVFLGLVYGKLLLVPVLYYASDITADQLEGTSGKLYEVASYLENDGEILEKKDSNIYAYKIRYELSEGNFLASPWIGGGKRGGHHFWIDNLAEHGILGTMPWIFVFVFFYRSTKPFFSKAKQILVFNSLVIFILIGTNKNILIYSMPVHLFFIVPLFLIVHGKVNFLRLKLK